MASTEVFLLTVGKRERKKKKWKDTTIYNACWSWRVTVLSLSFVNSGADKLNSISEVITCWNDKAGTTVWEQETETDKENLWKQDLIS